MKLTINKSAGKASIALVVGIGLYSMSVFAHTGATGIVKQRMDGMSAIGAAHKALTAIFSGKQKYDAQTVRKSAKVIASHAGVEITKLFPKGSIKGPSEALPQIWTNWPEFERLANDLAVYAAALEKSADNKAGPPAGKKQPSMMGNDTMMGTGMMGNGMMADKMDSREIAKKLVSMPPFAAYQHVTRTCAACHTQFRKKKNK